MNFVGMTPEADLNKSIASTMDDYFGIPKNKIIKSADRGSPTLKQFERAEKSILTTHENLNSYRLPETTNKKLPFYTQPVFSAFPKLKPVLGKHKMQK